VRSTIAELLASEGHLVLEAENGLQGLQVAHERLPDLILLDFMMPVMDGWAFLAAQQSDAVLAQVPVVVVSASVPEHVHTVGAKAHLHKPFALQELFDVVDRHASPA
jgi:CheY-like chemotaxis protein